MPTYGFRCPEGHEVDRFYKTMSSAPATIECPECGKMSERQLHGGAGLLFKGSGFYLTDYGKNAHRSDAKPTTDAKADTKSDTKADTKADTKTDKKADPKPKAESKPAKTPKAE
jgi:putative FmdB family regulatory protein